MNDYRGTKSPHGGAHPGKWPYLVDRDDIRTVHFRDPTTKQWHQLEWEHAPGIDAPFSAHAAAYVRALGAKSQRHVDPQQAVQDLLAGWPQVKSPTAATGTSRCGSPPNAHPGRRHC